MPSEAVLEYSNDGLTGAMIAGDHEDAQSFAPFEHIQDPLTQQLQSTTKQACWSSPPTQAEWERHRPKIMKLYKEHTLDQVKHMMEAEYNFKASIKMFKDRRRKWTMGKNIKSHEMKAIIRKRAQRARTGKETVFWLRKSRVPEFKIARYKKSLGPVSEQDLLDLRAATPPGLKCHTPLVQPLSAPHTFETTERIIKSIQDYVNGSFDSLNWYMDQSHNCRSSKTTTLHDTTRHFFNECFYAIERFKSCNSESSWRLLNAGMTLVEAVVSEENPYLLDRLTLLVRAYGSEEESSGIVLLILKQFVAMCQTKLGRRHPLNQVFGRLVGLGNSAWYDTINLARQSLQDCFARRVGRFGWITLQMETQELSIPFRSNAQQAETRSLCLLHDIESMLGLLDKRHQYARQKIAQLFLFTGNYIKAAELAEANISAIGVVQHNQHSGNCLTLSESFCVLANARYQLSDMFSAETNIRRAINTRSRCFGFVDSGTLHYMSVLECWLNHWGRANEAIQISGQIAAILDWKQERLLKAEEERWRKHETNQAHTRRALETCGPGRALRHPMAL